MADENMNSILYRLNHMSSEELKRFREFGINEAKTPEQAMAVNMFCDIATHRSVQEAV